MKPQSGIRLVVLLVLFGFVILLGKSIIDPAIASAAPPRIYVGGCAVVTGANSAGGLRVRSGPGTNYTQVGTIYDGTVVRITGGPASGSGYTWWQHDHGGWSAANWLADAACEESGNIQLVEGLRFSPSSPQVNQSTNAYYRARNNGSASITLGHLGVKCRRNSDQANYDYYWYTNVTLSPGQEFTYDANRSFDTATSYWCTPNYELGGNWNDVKWPNGSTNYVTLNVQNTPPPGNIQLVEGLRFSPSSPQVNQSTNAYYRARNNGGQSITLGNIGVKCRRNSDQANYDYYWYTNVTLAPGQEFTNDTNRSFDTAGSYWCTPNYEQGGNWNDVKWPDGSTNYLTLNVQNVTPPDPISPAAITDLTASTGSTAGTVNLSWTAPGDDGNIGTASTYIVRYADSAIGSELGWATATDVDGEPTPQVAGSAEGMIVSGLTPGQNYYFMVRAEDEVPNLSGLGNSPSAVAGDGATYYSISGRVTDNAGNPITDVKVEYDQNEAFTNGNGEYTIIDLPANTYTLTPSKSGWTFTPASRTVSVPPSATGQDFAGSEGGNVSIVLVQDESGNLVSGAQVYRNGNLAGTTSATGVLNIHSLQDGNELVARQWVTEVTTAKGNHNQDASQNWAYRAYITSLDIPTIGEPKPFIVRNPALTQTLTIKKDNALIGFNIVASVEWDANSGYLDELQQGFEKASAYLYDASDGQMLFERVTLYDNAQNELWADADYQIRASNQQWPRANPGAILSSGDLHIFLGRYFDGESANQGAWTQPDAFRTQIHEFGHYGLGLYDSYFYYQLVKRDSHCTSADIRTNNTPSTNATLMDYQYNATEFSMQGVSGLWSDQCKQTHQWQVHGKSDWETFVLSYTDTINPARWTLKTPGMHGGVVAGPAEIPVSGWFTATIGNNANTGICASPPIVQAQNVFGLGVPLVKMTLKKNNGRVIYQGQSGWDGRLVILGAADGDTVQLKGLLNSAQSTISCVSGQSVSGQGIGATELVVTLEPDPFNISVSVLPGGTPGTVQANIGSSVSLDHSPAVNLYQSGAALPIAVTMSYDSGAGVYTGTAALDTSLPSSGNIEVNATDTEGHSLQVFNTFNLSSVTVSEDVTVFSADGQVELYLPAGSLSADGRLSIAPDSSSGASPEDLVMLSGPYSIQAESGITLTGSAGLTMKYLDTGGSLRHADLSTVQIYRWDDSAGQWVPINSNILEDHNEVSASISAFGIYAAMAERLSTVYLPIILKHQAFGPDLVVDSLVATSDAVTVTIKNEGNVPVSDDVAHEFWVDLYINPSRKPGYNETWWTMGCQGAAWGVTWSGDSHSPPDLARQALPLEPGEVFTLTTRGDYYWWSKEGITWPLAQGASVYAQVDSASDTTSYGGVLESNEDNNVSGPFTVQDFGATSPPVPSPDEGPVVVEEKPEEDISKTSLPLRP